MCSKFSRGGVDWKRKGMNNFQNSNSNVLIVSLVFTYNEPYTIKLDELIKL